MDGRTSLKLIPSYSVIINCSVIFLRGAFACYYLLLTEGQQPIKCGMEKQIGSSGIFQASLFSPLLVPPYFDIFN